MEENKRKFEGDKRDQEIVYSKAIKAGKRIYYLDVKRNRKDDLFLAITESKKKVNGDDAQVSFEKHKIFLYKEDFEKFKEGFEEVIGFINQNMASSEGESDDSENGHDAPNRFEIDFG
ncbi:MAG: PUR family DNA/RNA-binding protein [Paludibacteraceae bacterium]|nr:PUR family DNA/RNA-binding protein [Paludibacteraceae bacterium]